MGCSESKVSNYAIIIIIYPLTARVVGAPQIILQPVSSIFPCSPLPSGTWRTPGLSIPYCCLPTSSSVCLVFFPLSLCLARWFWSGLMNWKHDYTTAVCVSLGRVRISPECTTPNQPLTSQQILVFKTPPKKTQKKKTTTQNKGLIFFKPLVKS